METMQTIFVEVLHHNFWWGIYGMTELTDWEDLILYEKRNEEFQRIGQVCICTQRYFVNGLANLRDEPDERMFVDDIEWFLHEKTLSYHFWYDSPRDENFHEVSFEAERDMGGNKPSYIEMWYPEDGIDIDAIELCATDFYEKYGGQESVQICWKEIVPFEDAVRSYLLFVEHMNRMNPDGPVIEFSEEAIKALSSRWGKAEGEVLGIIAQSLQGSDVRTDT